MKIHIIKLWLHRIGFHKDLPLYFLILIVSFSKIDCHEVMTFYDIKTKKKPW